MTISANYRTRHKNEEGSCRQLPLTNQKLLTDALELAIHLHELDQTDQFSEQMEREFSNIHKRLMSLAACDDQPHIISLGKKVYQVCCQGDGITYAEFNPKLSAFELEATG